MESHRQELKMNSRERLTRLHSNQEVDRPGVFCRTDESPAEPEYDELKNYISSRTDVKRNWNGRANEMPFPMDVIAKPYSEMFERVETVLHTPMGDLGSIYFNGLKGNAGLHETHFIRCAEDAEKYLSLAIPEVKGDVSSYFELDRQIGDRGVPYVHVGLNPGGFVTELMGTEGFALMTITDRDIVHALIDMHMKMTINSIKFLLDNKVGPFFCMDGEEYIVPPIHSPRDFHDFNVKYDKPIVDLVHNAGGYFHIHSHNRIKSVLDGFLEIGPDVLHPFEAPPMGDITAKEAKDVIRGKICFEGNIQIADMYECTPDQVREQTRQLILDAFDDHKGLIVSPSAGPFIPGQGKECMERYKAMIETVLEYKG
jgi:hypothetical protein